MASHHNPAFAGNVAGLFSTSGAMLEIILTLLCFAFLAKRKPTRRRSMGNYLKGNVDEILSLGTLASVTLISSDFDEAVTEKTLVTSLVASFSLDNLTSPQGPILFGVAHSDYTDAEIEAVIESTGSWAVGDLVQSKEVAKRLVRIIGQFASNEPAATVDVSWNNGRPVKTKLNWMLNTGQTLNLWAYNKSASALSTTVPIVVCSGHVNLFSK